MNMLDEDGEPIAFVRIVRAEGFRARIRIEEETLEVGIVAYGVAKDGRLHPLMLDGHSLGMLTDHGAVVEHVLDAVSGEPITNGVRTIEPRRGAEA